MRMETWILNGKSYGEGRSAREITISNKVNERSLRLLNTKC